jgi:hypothetical protein
MKSPCLTLTSHTSEHNVNILHKRLRLCAYKIQLVQALGPDDHPRRAAFATEMLQRTDKDNDYVTRVCFSDKAIFHTSW